MSHFEEKMKEEVRKKNPWYKSMSINGVALFAQKEDGPYDLYLPFYGNYHCDSPCNYFPEPYFICSDIEEFQFLEDENSSCDAAFFIKVKKDKDSGFWAPIFPSHFCFYLNERKASGRFESTPKFEFHGNSCLKVLDDFRYLRYIAGHGSYVFSIDDKTYLIKCGNNSIYSSEMNVDIHLIKNKIFPVACEGYFLEDDGSKKCIYHSYDYSPVFGPAYSIKKLSEDVYKTSDNSAAYISQDENGNYLGIFNVGKKGFHYKTVFDTPAKHLMFLTQVIDKIDYNSYQSKATIIDFWGATFEDGKKEILVRAYGDARFEFNVSPDSLQF